KLGDLSVWQQSQNARKQSSESVLVQKKRQRTCGPGNFLEGQISAVSAANLFRQARELTKRLRERTFHTNQDFSFSFQTQFAISVIQSQQLASDHIIEVHWAFEFRFQIHLYTFFAG